MALQRPGVIFALVVGQRAHGIGAGDVGGAAVILTAAVHQQEAVGLDGAVGAGLGGVVHHGGIGAVGRNGEEALLIKTGLLGTTAVQHDVDVALPQGLALGQGLFQVHLEAHHRHTVPDVAFLQVGQLGGVLDALEGGDRVGALLQGQVRVGLHGGVQVIVGGVLFHQNCLVAVQRVDKVQQGVVVPQLHAVGAQHIGVVGIQAALCQEEDAAVHRHKGIGDGHGAAGNVMGAQVQQPGHAVQLGDGQGGGAGLFQLGTDSGQLFRRGGAGLLPGKQEAGGIRQGGTLRLPQGVDHVLADQAGTHLGQGGVVLFKQGGGHAAAVGQHGLAGGQVRFQVFLHRGDARRGGVHRLDLGAGQLTVGLDIKTAVRPEGAALAGDNQGGVLAGKTGEPVQAGVAGGQVFAGMGITGDKHHAVGAGSLGGSPQSGNLFVGGHIVSHSF